jgi:hypothetical protein
MKNQIFGLLLLGSILFYQLTHYNNEKLLAIIIIIVFGYFAYIYINNLKKDEINNNNNIKENINKESEKRNEIESEIFPIKKFPKNKKFKYLYNNTILVEIIDGISILRMFDRARYSDLIMYCDNLQKIYMYILADRYNPEIYIPIFIDLSDKISEILYSLIFVIPDKLKHVYGVDPDKRMNEIIERFTALRMKMLNILKNYAYIEKEVKYLPDISFRPSNSYSSGVLF